MLQVYPSVILFIQFYLFLIQVNMGAQNSSILYAQPITEKPQGQTSVYRHPDFKDKLIDQVYPGGKTLKDVLIHSKNTYAQKYALGSIIRNENEQKIHHLTYKEFFEKGHALGSAIVTKNLYNTDSQNKMDFIGIFSKNRAEWSIVDIAGILFKIVTIPIYDTLGNENISYVLKHTSLKTLFLDKIALNILKKTTQLDKLEVLVSFDLLENQDVQFFTQKNIKLIHFDDLLKEGGQYLIDYSDDKFKVSPQDCLTFSYTSGTTGPPKGVMISHKNAVSSVGAAKKQKDYKINSNDVILSYLPLPHIMQRLFLYCVFSFGGQVVYFSGDITKIKDDITLVKPTIFASVPRLYSKFYEAIQSKFNSIEGSIKFVLDYALQSKLTTVKTTGQFTHPFYDKILFSKTRQVLGGRCRLMLTGGAPLLPEVHNFMKVVMCCPLLEGYGQTQSTGATFISEAMDPQTRHVGAIMGQFQFKLVDIPEMNYLSTDRDDRGRPSPRGEIWVRGNSVFLGYYKDQQKTNQTITKDGWLKTGDVGQILPQTKAMKIIDRKKNIFKLQQGQYVASEKVQNIYLKNEYVDQIFVYGEPTETFCIAIAVPNKKRTQQMAFKKNIKDKFEDLCNKKEIRLQILKSLNNTGKQQGLNGFQQAKNIFLQSKTFLQKGILTNTMKIQRFQARKQYRQIIDQLYTEKELK